MAAGHLEEWTESEAFVSVQGQMLRVDRNCAVRISSFGDEECPTDEKLTDEDHTTVVIIAAVVPAVVIILLIIVLSTVVAVKCKKTTTQGRV